MRTPLVQISLDFQTMEDALRTAQLAVRAGVDWLEAGTPLLLSVGTEAVRALRANFPHHPIIADMKCMDGGYGEAEMMFRAGATHVVVMALAHSATVAGAIAAARKRGGAVMADLMLCPDKAQAAQQMEALGVDIVILHTGYDERHAEQGKSPLDDLDAVRAAVRIPVQAVGGVSLEQAPLLPGRGAEIVVIGAPLAVPDTSTSQELSDDALYALIADFVRRVKATGNDENVSV